MVCSNGSACVMPILVSEIKPGQRVFCNSGYAAMGYELPVALGATVDLAGKRDGLIYVNNCNWKDSHRCKMI